VDKKVIVEYKTQQDYCDCCGQKIEKPKTSKTKEFHISKYDCYSYLSEDDWKIESEDETELERIVEEFVCGTIEFYATSSYEVILIEKSEIKKVKNFILDEIVA